MLKSITCAAMAAITLGAFAQTGSWSANDGMKSKSGFYYCDADLLANPPTAKNADSFSDMKWNIHKQAEGLKGADRFDFEELLIDAPGNISNSLMQALYNVRCQADMARHDLVAEAVANDEMMAMTPAPGYTYFFAQTPSTLSAQTMTTDFTDVDNRPMRMVLNQPNTPNITYDDASDIISSELSGGARESFETWFWNDASDRDRDVLVRVLKADAAYKCAPIYASTLTKSPW